MELADGYQPIDYTLDAIDWTKVLYPVEIPGRVVNLEAPRSSTQYSEDGRVLAEIDELGNKTEYKYNPLGQLTQVTYPEVDGVSSSVSYDYDSAGRRIRETDSLGNKVEYKYDKLGRAVEVIFEDNSSNQTTFDSLGRRTQSIDQSGIITNYEYDNLGRLHAVVQKVSENEIGTRYSYNEIGQLVEVEDAKGRVTKYEYDDGGRRVAVVLPGGERASTTYDELGNIASYTDFNGETTNYEYDSENRLEKKDLEDDIDIEYSYTEDGQVATITDSRGTTEFGYDELGYLVSRKDAIGPYLASGNTIEYDYDEIGNITEVRTPAGTVGYKYDSWNRLQKAIEGADETRYVYDEVGNLVRTEFSNGTVETRAYDELYRLKEVKVVDGEDKLVSEFKYELNEAGHRRKVTEKVRQPDGSLSERVVDYDYDELYRLIEAAVVGGETITYTYDEVGNRLTAGAISYVYDDNDRLIEEREGGEVIVRYEYDDNGNLLSRTDVLTNETVNYTWDDRNRLVEVDDNGEVVKYEYDDDNIRVSQTVAGEKTSFLLDKNRPYDQVLAEYTDGSLEASYTYGLDLISQERNGMDSFYVVDGLGSTRGLTDGSGEVTDAYWYDAYGNLVERVGGSENDYLFAGEQFDEELGQYYLRQRYYDAAIGRFTRRDTYEGSLDQPISLHKYLYTNGNPINYVDPSGLVASSTELSAANVIRDTLTKIYSQAAERALSIAQSGGTYSLQTLATEIAWELGPSVFNAGVDYTKAVIGGIRSNKQILKNRAKYFKEVLGLGELNPKRPNFAFADIQIKNQTPTTLLALSGRTRPKQVIGGHDVPLYPMVGQVQPGDHFFKALVHPQVNGWLRDTDSEYKILEAFAAKYQNNRRVKGTIHLVTELEDCKSCRDVIKRQFKKMFPNVDIKVSYFYHGGK